MKSSNNTEHPVKRLKSADFEVFKSNVCHEVKSAGDLRFIKRVLLEKRIDDHMSRKEYKEGLYLLAMIDYLSRIHNIPLYNRYDSYRTMKFEKPIWPVSVRLVDALCGDDAMKKAAMENVIPEFLRHNIIEGDIRDVY